MIVKPSFTIGIKDSGEVDLLKIGSPDECREWLLEESTNPSGKYVQIQLYRKPPYTKRRDIKVVADAPKKRGRKASN